MASGIWRELKEHGRRWQRHEVERVELIAQRRDLIARAADELPVAVIADLLGVTGEAIYKVLRASNTEVAK